MTSRRTVGIIQARMGSTRLPGKVLAEIAGVPMLVRTFERARRAATVDEWIVATTRDPADDALGALCVERGLTASSVEAWRTCWIAITGQRSKPGPMSSSA